jgi:predicted RNA-binding Zn ribbon-like protein
MQRIGNVAHYRDQRRSADLTVPAKPPPSAWTVAAELRARHIRVCAAENCGLLLVDTSRPRRRRWCSMEHCGNRAKIRTHRSRA